MAKLKYIVSFAFLLFFFVISSTIIYAHTPDEQIAEETIQSDYYLFDETVVLDKSVSGDAYVAGGSVLVNSKIEGDLLVAGGSVTLNGEVKGDVRVAGGTVIVNGIIGRNLTVAGGNISISDDARVGGNILGLGGSIVLTWADVKGNVNFWGGEIKIGDKAVINGDVKYVSDNKAEISNIASIGGELIYNKRETSVDDRPKAALFSGLKVVHNFFILSSFIISFLLGFLLLKLFPKRMLFMADMIQKKPLRSFMVGVAMFCIVPVILVLLMITLVGIPLSLSLGFLWLILIYIAKIPVGFYVGRVVLKNLGLGVRCGWALLTGLLLYYLTGYIIFVGWLVKLVVIFLGIGVLIIEKYNFYKMLTSKNQL